MKQVPVRLLLSGYYGFDNFGDEAILRVFVDEWRRRRDADEITVLSSNPRMTRARYAVEAISRVDWLAIRRAVKRSDLVVSGGGGLLQTATSVRSLVYYASIIREAARAGKPATIFAQGIGPLNYLGRQIVRRACARVERATVRDGASLQMLRALLPAADVKLAADPVFLASTSASADARERLAREGIRADAGPLVAVFVRRGALLERMISDVAAAVDRLETEHGAHAVFVPMQLPEDADAAVAVIRRCKTTPVLLVGGYDLAAMSALLSQCAGVISMRLHAIVLAARLGVPFLVIPHDPKLRALADELHYPLPLFDRDADPKTAVDRLLSQPAQLREHLQRSVAPLVQRASVAFDTLQDLVQGRPPAREKQP